MGCIRPKKLLCSIILITHNLLWLFNFGHNSIIKYTVIIKFLHSITLFTVQKCSGGINVCVCVFYTVT